MIEIEEFRDIPGYEGMYEVSNLGRVRRNGKILKPGKDRYGYLHVDLYKNGTKRTFTIHRLVAFAFLSNPNKYPEVNHRDEDKTNNCVDNLEWCDSKYNSNYSNAKPVLQFSKNGDFIAEYESGVEAGRITGINNKNISSCCSGRYGFKTAGGYLWKFKN